jgi:hypothetical protein
MAAPEIKEDRHSGTSTYLTIWYREAPMDMHASITPGSTVSMADSVILATNGIAEMVRGTMAAKVPTDVPVMSLVNGTIATMRMTNGIDLPIFTTVLKTE